jgi:DNA-binding HxlR family transcriptional regulator
VCRQVDHARQVLLSAALGQTAAHQREVGAEEFRARVSYDEVPPRVEYSLTESGIRLNDALQPLAAWGREQQPPARTS